MPVRPLMMPPVGKSGPLMCFIRPATPISGSSMYATTASIDSRRLCGGMFVAIPTAMPVPPSGLKAGLVHREQHTAVDRLEAVAYVGQRPAHDHAHRVIEVRRPHLLLEPAGLDAAAGECVHRAHQTSRLVTSRACVSMK